MGLGWGISGGRGDRRYFAARVAGDSQRRVHRGHLARVDDPLSARCLAVSDGETTLAIAIVDSCMVPRDVCDEIKQRVAKTTGLPASRILITATHTHRRRA